MVIDVLRHHTYSVRYAVGRERKGHEKTPSGAGGAYRSRATPLDRRARPPGYPPMGMLVVLATNRTITHMLDISHAARARSRQAVSNGRFGSPLRLPLTADTAMACVMGT